MVGEARRPTPGTAPADEVIAELAGVMRDALANAGLELSALQGVGVGWPGPANEQAGTVERAVHVAGLKDGYPLTDALAAALGAPAYVGNDVQVATNAEFALGAGKEYRSILGVFWGTGVGGGIVLDGKPWTGRGSAGEIGHVVVREDGRRCPCGRRGCMEAYAGRAAMEARARREVRRGKHTMLFEIMEERGRNRLTSGMWERALHKGDPRRDAAAGSCRAGARDRRRLVPERARRRGGRDRGRAGRAARPHVPRADHGRDHDPPVLADARRRADRGAGRSGRGDRCVAPCETGFPPRKSACTAN